MGVRFRAIVLGAGGCAEKGRSPREEEGPASRFGSPGLVATDSILYIVLEPIEIGE